MMVCGNGPAVFLAMFPGHARDFRGINELGGIETQSEVARLEAARIDVEMVEFDWYDVKSVLFDKHVAYRLICNSEEDR